MKKHGQKNQEKEKEKEKEKEIEIEFITYHTPLKTTDLSEKSYRNDKNLSMPVVYDSFYEKIISFRFKRYSV